MRFPSTTIRIQFESFVDSTGGPEASSLLGAMKRNSNDDDNYGEDEFYDDQDNFEDGDIGDDSFQSQRNNHGLEVGPKKARNRRRKLLASDQQTDVKKRKMVCADFMSIQRIKYVNFIIAKGQRRGSSVCPLKNTNTKQWYG